MDYLAENFPLLDFEIRGGIGFRGLFLKNFIISDVATFRDFAYICAKRNAMNILCKSPVSPQHEIFDFLRISLKDTPAEGYYPMAGGEVVRIGH